MTIMVESAMKGGQYLWTAPTYDQVRTGWLETKRATGGAVDFNISTMTATFPSGGTVIYRSLDDPDNARGKTANGIVIDECGDVQEAAWYEVLRPMLIDTGGWAWGIGTPKGHNWFWQEHYKALDRDDSMAWQAPTLGVAVKDGRLVRERHPLENPFIPFEEIVNLYNTMPERVFEQEIVAAFVPGNSGVFRRVREAATLPRREPYDGEFVAGLDWAQSHDFTVMVVMDATTRQVVDMDRFNQVDWAIQRGRVKNMAERWRLSNILAESNSIGGPNIEALWSEGLPVTAFETTAVTKGPLIESLVLAFERGEIAILDDAVLVGELEAYERTVSAVTGRSRYGAPEGMHDDTVMALALALQACGDARSLFAWGGEDYDD